jgi:hypothetical protein
MQVGIFRQACDEVRQLLLDGKLDVVIADRARLEAARPNFKQLAMTADAVQVSVSSDGVSLILVATFKLSQAGLLIRAPSLNTQSQIKIKDPTWQYWKTQTKVLVHVSEDGRRSENGEEKAAEAVFFCFDLTTCTWTDAPVELLRELETSPITSNLRGTDLLLAFRPGELTVINTQTGTVSLLFREELNFHDEDDDIFVRNNSREVAVCWQRTPTVLKTVFLSRPDFQVARVSEIAWPYELHDTALLENGDMRFDRPNVQHVELWLLKPDDTLKLEALIPDTYDCILLDEAVIQEIPNWGGTPMFRQVAVSRRPRYGLWTGQDLVQLVD